MSHPPGLPELFLDRSLGRVVVPKLLRRHGLQVVTLAEDYGMPDDESVPDEVWLRDVSHAGRVALTKDARISRRPAERLVVDQFSVRVFAITNMSLRSQQMADLVIANLSRMVRACEQPGPFIYSLHPDRIDRRHPR